MHGSAPEGLPHLSMSLARRSTGMAKPKKAAKPSSMTSADENGAASDETSAIEDGKILDYITGKPVAENDKERIRQRMARAMFHEYGISVEDMQPDFKVKVDG